ncbi:MAG: DUF2608 domain-containing protein [Alphaproteobacteria bacterium]|jgi:hypothetical protein|nr:DUF2608 domain-containing protein [Alphaproteobacteria bacterium]MBT5389281.1 DUF2608 domain-containing protein [Alphaproteobacteria bacterium]
MHKFEEAQSYFTQADEDTLVLFDVDGVLTHSDDPAFQLGSLYKHIDEFRNIKNSLSPSDFRYLLWSSLIDTGFLLVDANAPKFVQELQEKGAKLIGLTGAPSGSVEEIKSFPELRNTALQGFGIDFSTTLPYTDAFVFNNFPMFNGNHPLFYKGIIYCNQGTDSAPKEEILLNFLERLKWTPKHIFFFEDRKGNLEAMETALKKHLPNTKFTGIHFKGGLAFPNQSISKEKFVARWKKLAEKIGKKIDSSQDK